MEMKKDDDQKRMYSEKLAGKEPLDDEMLPNQGEPVEQPEEPPNQEIAPIKGGPPKEEEQT